MANYFFLAPSFPTSVKALETLRKFSFEIESLRKSKKFWEKNGGHVERN